MIATILKPIKTDNKNLVTKKVNALDEKWYGALHKIGLVQVNRLFEGDAAFSEQQKMDFMAGLTENPVFEYPLLDVNEIKEKISKYRNLKKTIVNQEGNQVVIDAYIPKLDELIAKSRLIISTYNLVRYRHDPTLTNKWQEQFQTETEHIHGRPKNVIFKWVINNIRQELSKHRTSKDISLAENSRLLLAMLPRNEEEVNLFQMPSAKLLQKVRKKFVGRMVDLPNNIDNNYLFDALEIQKIFIDVLRNYNLTDWQVLVSPNVFSISVDQGNKIIRVPKKRKAYSSKIFKLIVHEIGTHIVRRTNGENSKLKLLGIGLDGYEKGEEGIATIGEQMIFNKKFKFPFSKQIAYLSIGLAYGLDGQKRDFRQVFLILEKLYYILKKKLTGAANKKETEILNEAREKAWSRCVRTFRGTTGDIPGLCYTKDIIYLEGKLCVWNLINNDSSEIDRFFCGKYDPCNLDHVKILDQLGIGD